MSTQTLPEIIIEDQEDLVVISQRQYQEMVRDLQFYQARHERNQENQIKLEDLIESYKSQYQEILSRLEWYEGEQQRLEDRIDEFDREQYFYSNRNNSLEG